MRVSILLRPSRLNLPGLCCAILLSLGAHTSLAQEAARAPASPAPSPSPAANQASEIVVTGTTVEAPEKNDLTPDQAAAPASTTIINPTATEKRSTKTYGDFLRPITGVTVNNFGQGGIGYGIALRGFADGDHGRDIAYFVDGVPNNEASSLHINGYSDLNPLIPEVVDNILLIRGPFSVRAGDFGLGGSLFIKTELQPPTGLYLSGGSFNTGRALGIYSFKADGVEGFGSLLGSTTEGYRDNQYLHEINTFDKIGFPLLDGQASLRLQVFSDDFGAPGYINRALVESGKLSPTAAVNSTDGGSKTEENLVFNYAQDDPQPVTVTAYLIHNIFKRWADFATAPIDPDFPGQRLQTDRRFELGANVEKYWQFNLPLNVQGDFFVGTGDRSDIARSSQFATIRRTPTSTSLAIDFDQNNPYAYAELDIKPVPWMKLTGGLRYDEFLFDIDDHLDAINTSSDTSGFEPKAGIAITPVKGLDFFANYGEGVRSPSAVAGFGLDPNLPVSKNSSEEVGLQYNSPDGRWHFLGDVYHTEFDHEIVENAPPEPPTVLGPSKRDGFDVEGRFRIFQAGSANLFFYANYSKVRARLSDEPVGGNRIANVAGWLGTYGLDFVFPIDGQDSPHLISLSAYQNWVGPKALTANDVEHTETYSFVSATLSYTNRNWKGFSVFGRVEAYPNGSLDESAFDFGGVVGVDPKAPYTLESGVFIPL